LRYQRACNWLQALEGDFDSSHLSFLHLAYDEKLQDTGHERKAGIEYYRNIARMDKQPLLEVVDTDIGVMYGARRAAEESGFYWRVTEFLLPFYTSVPAYCGKNRAKAWVPLDDEHTMVWEPNWSATHDLTEEEQKGWKGRVPPSGFLPDTKDGLGYGRFVANAGNDYFLDRKKQRSFNFSGLENVTTIQDGAMTESMGRSATGRRSILALLTRRSSSSAGACFRSPESFANKTNSLPASNTPSFTGGTAIKCC